MTLLTKSPTFSPRSGGGGGGAEAYHVAVFSAVKTAQKASEALDKVCGEVRAWKIDHRQIQQRVVASGTSVFSEHH